MENCYYVIGIDVGGTNTDTVILKYPSKEVISSVKTPTTKDIYTGVYKAIQKVLEAQKEVSPDQICFIMLGTTTFLNAVVQRSEDLSPVSVVRLCGKSALNTPPFVDFPQKLRQKLEYQRFNLSGGFEFSAQPLSEFSEPEVESSLSELVAKFKEDQESDPVRFNWLNLVVTGVFSPLDPSQEEKVAQMFESKCRQQGVNHFSCTLSHNIGQLGLLEREAAAILNASLRPLAQKAITSFKAAIKKVKLKCASNFFLCQNDGTLITCERAIQYPVYTFSGGPMNSLRGASALTNRKDAMVVDIGGTSTDIAFLVKGFPRDSANYSEVGGVRTNFRMPDLFSIALGGGSVVTFDDQGEPQVGPKSVGYRIQKEALSFGGSVLTTTDVALKSGIATIPGTDPAKVELKPEQLARVQAQIISMIENTIDQVKTSAEPAPLILVGGGSMLVPLGTTIQGASEVIRPENFEVANAVGAAISQVSNSLDRVVVIKEGQDEEQEVNKLKETCVAMAVQNGAIQDTVEINQIEKTQLSYLPGKVYRVTMKAVGDLDIPRFAQRLQESSEAEQQQVSEADFQESEELEEKDTFALKSLEREEQEQKERSLQELLDYKPRVVQNEGRNEWILSELDLDFITLGAGVLGTGGGGSPYVGALLTKKLLREGKKIRVIAPESVRAGELVPACGFLGAPLVAVEKLPTGEEVVESIRAMQEHLSKEGGSVGALVSAEIGGLNSVVPLFVAAVSEQNYPVVDADLMGRAFPFLYMVTSVIYGMSPFPLFIANEKGDRKMCLSTEQGTPESAHEVAIGHCIGYGCSAGLSLTPMNHSQIHQMAVKYSLSRAWMLGRAITIARREHQNPVERILQTENGSCLFRGKVASVSTFIEDANNKGEIKLIGFEDFKGQTMEIKFRNEFLVASLQEQDGTRRVAASVPDLICVVNMETGEPFMADEIKYGLRVLVITIPSDDLLRTETALSKVGPAAFGYPGVEFKAQGQVDKTKLKPVSELYSN